MTTIILYSKYYSLGILITEQSIIILNRIWFKKEQSTIKLPPLFTIISLSIVSWCGFAILITILIIDYILFLGNSNLPFKKHLCKLFNLRE
jgi:hypothetical protein